MSILTPTGRYAEPFVRCLASSDLKPAPLWIVEGKGSFGRQVADGAERYAGGHGTKTKRIDAAKPTDRFPTSSSWDMLSAGTFESDVQTVTNGVDHPDGTFGVGQWFRHPTTEPEPGPPSETFLATYADAFGTSNPDYPAIQATAAALVATHCLRKALWSTVVDLKTSTLFGDFGVDPDTGMQLRHQAGATTQAVQDRLRRYASPVSRSVSKGRTAAGVRFRPAGSPALPYFAAVVHRVFHLATNGRRTAPMRRVRA